MRKFILLAGILTLSQNVFAVDQFECKGTNGSNTYSISGCAPYHLGGPGNSDCRYISVKKNNSPLKEFDTWGGIVTGSDDASMMGISIPFGVDDNKSDFSLRYSQFRKEAQFSLGIFKRIKLKDLSCNFEEPSWYSVTLSGVIYKNIKDPSLFSEKLLFLSPYINEAEEFGVKFEGEAENVYEIVLRAVLKDKSSLELILKKRNGWGKDFPDFEKVVTKIKLITEGRVPRWGYQTIDLSHEEYNQLTNLPSLQSLRSFVRNAGSSGVSYEIYHDAH